MAAKRGWQVREALAGDAHALGRLLHDFNSEYESYTPGPELIAERVAPLIESGEVTALVGGESPEGLAVLRFRPSIWRNALESYLEELYVVPAERGNGLGRALIDAAMALALERGALEMHICTSTDDLAARGLYESLGFTNREGAPDGPVMLFYEREL